MIPNTPEAQKANREAFDMAAYGGPREEILESLDAQAKMVGKGMLMLSILSDVQELLRNGQAEEARKLVNQAKMFFVTRVAQKDALGRLL